MLAVSVVYVTVSIGLDLERHVELQPLTLCVWTVGEQVDIVPVKRREIDGVC